MGTISERRVSALLGTAAVSTALLMLLACVAYPPSTQAYLFQVHGFSSYPIAVVFFVDGIRILSCWSISKALRRSVAALLHLVYLALVGGLLDTILLASDRASGWRFGGLLGSLPYQLFAFIPIVLVRCYFAIFLALLCLGLCLMHRVQVLCRRKRAKPVAAIANEHIKPQVTPEPAPTPIQKEPAATNQQVQTTRIERKFVDQPIPLAVLSIPSSEMHENPHLNADLLASIEQKIIGVAYTKLKFTIRRVQDREPKVGYHVISYAFDPDEKNSILVNRMLTITDDLGVLLGRAPVMIRISEHIFIDVPLSDTERAFVPIQPLLEEVLRGGQDVFTYLFGRDAFGAVCQLPVRTCLHMLVGGQTQSGKTMMLHTLIFGFLFRYPPSQVRLALYDHKMEEFTCYRNLPHLWCPVATTSSEFDRMLQLLEDEFQQRKIKRSQDRRKTFPLIVVVMDEFRGLTTDRLVTLISECRSLNMVFILATQYPRNDIISTPVKANLVTGVCFKTRDSQASRLIIGEVGGERLMGKGDCMIHSPLALDRIQGSYCTLEDLEALESYLDAQVNAT